MRSRLSNLALALLLTAAMTSPATAQLNPITTANKGPVIDYRIAFPNVAHHEAEVTATFTALPAGPLHARMARSSTGRYALHEYAKNVYDVKAFDSKGKALRVTRPDAYGWDISGHDGTVKITYTIFANRADGTYSGFDQVQAHIQPQGTFMYARGLEARPIKLVIDKPDPTWTVATQLVGDKSGSVFTAPGMQYFFDSPTHVGNIQWREWQLNSSGRTQTIRTAVDDPAPASSIDVYADGAKKIVSEAAAVYGELPAFDYGSYTFVACYRPSCSGDGMEHRNSTSVTGGNSMGDNGNGPLGTVSHEFFHTWNVKRIRPKTLEPFDYDRANMSDALWIAEGFTQYYGPLVMTRAGLSSAANFPRGLSGTVNAVTNSPGRRIFGPIQMSQQAVFQDAGVSIDQQNTANNFISYYTYGAGIALALDLSLRSHGKSLDDFMRQMWLQRGKPQIAYTLEDARRILGGVAGDTAWANNFWTRYVEGHELPDYNALLEPAGMLVRKSQANAPWIGLNFGGGGNRGGARGGAQAPAATASGYTITGAVLVGTPAYAAGLETGDRILAVDGKEVSADSVLASAVASKKPGEKLNLSYEGRAGRRETSLTVAENPAVQVVTFEDAGKTPTAAQLAFRAAWISSKVKN
ncbi:MAG: PDZ domain-containing protein [Gemmatimonadales bacterium]